MVEGLWGPALTRRALLGTATLAPGAMAVLTACGTSTESLRKLPATARRDDVELLNRLLELEYAGIYAYTAGIPLLNGRTRTDAQQFLKQELAHAGELAGLIREAGYKPVTGAQSYDLGHPQTETGVLELLRRIENEQITGYVGALPRLVPGPVRAAIASILANDAQHLSFVRAAVGDVPVPTAFVTGGE